MNPLVLLGYLGLPAYISNGALTSATLKDPNLKPTIAGYDARGVVGLVGLGIATIFSGPIALLGAGAALGSLTSYDNTRKVRIGLNQIALVQAQQQAQIPALPPPALPGSATPPIPAAPSAVPAEERGFLDNLFSWREAA